MPDRTILTDVDGVLLNWVGAFEDYVLEKYKISPHGHGHNSYDLSIAYNVERKWIQKVVREFNSSEHMLSIQPFANSVGYVRDLVEAGFKFQVITSFGGTPESREMRIQNLTEVFGEDAFVGFEFLGQGASKKEALQKYAGKNYLWLEDHPQNADDGLELGLQSVLFRQSYNEDYDGKAQVVNGWADIAEIVLDRMELAFTSMFPDAWAAKWKLQAEI